MDNKYKDIETKRLILVPISDIYAKSIFEEFNERITTYMYPRPPKEINETKDFISDSIRRMQEGTNYQLVILKKESLEFIGCIGMPHLLDEESEVGIWIKEKSFGNKYGIEAATGLVNWAKSQKKWKSLKYPVDKRNSPSRRIPEALQGKIIRSFKNINLSGNELDEVEYSIPLK